MTWKRFYSSRKKRNNFLKTFKKVEPIIHEIFSPIDRYVGQDYFRYIGPKLCELIGADYIMVGKLLSRQKQVESLVFCKGSQLLDAVSYSIEGTPCEMIVGKKACQITKGAWKRHYGDNLVANELIEGFIGIPLNNSQDKPNGIIWALFKDPIDGDVDAIESMMRLFTPRMSTEIEHLLAREELSKRNMELELMHRALRDKNKELDRSVEELSRTQLKSKEYDQLKTTFLANLSHEIRTPMNVILGFLELLRSDSLTTEERVDYLDIVNVNGMQLLKVMDNLIDISKLQTRLMQEVFSKISINDLLVQLKLHYLNEAHSIKKSIVINVHRGIADGSDSIITDQEALQKVLKHLMDNALKFTREGGCIEVGYEAINDKLRFFVKDDGIGVPQGQERIIFDMFRQGNESFNSEFGGNGLGLAISKKYIETLGGEIWLDSEYKDGAFFYFTIPYEQVQIKSMLTRAHIN